MPNDSKLNQSLRELRASAPISGMENAKDTFRFPATARKPRWVRPASVLAGGCAIAFTAVLVLAPAQAVGVDDLVHALQLVPASHSRYTVKGVVSMEFWAEGKKRRYAIEDTMERAYDGEVVTSLNKSNKYLVISEDKPDGFGPNGYGVEDRIRGMKSYAVRLTTTNRNVQKDGKDALEITLRYQLKADKKTDYRAVYFCDPETKRPFRSEFTAVKDGKETVRGVETIEFPSDIPDAFFRIEAPKGYATIDQQKVKQQIFARLHGEAPSKTVNGITVKLLAVTEDQTGLINVFFTNGAAPQIDSSAGILDSSGKGFAVWSMYKDRQHEPQAAAIKKPVGRVQIAKEHKTTYRVKLTPAFNLEGIPVYCIQTRPSGHRDFKPKKLKIILPICKPGPDRLLKVSRLGFDVAGNGVQVGKAEFQVETSPIEWYHSIVGSITGENVGGYGLIPLKGINVDQDRNRQLSALQK